MCRDLNKATLKGRDLLLLAQIESQGLDLPFPVKEVSIRGKYMTI